MVAAAVPQDLDTSRAIKLTSNDFSNNKYSYYEEMLVQAPVWKGKIAAINFVLIPRYQDCLDLLKDSRFVRNRTTATGGSRMPFPIPKSLQLLIESMILTDDADHRRLRSLVNKGFTSNAIADFEPKIEALTHELLDVAEKEGTVDLIPAYCLPVPMIVISEMVGISKEQMPRFANSIRVLSKGFSGWNILRTMLWDLRGVVRFFEELVAEKRANPQDDILTKLIEAEEEGDRLSQDELIATVFLLIVAGFETTTHLISNGVIELLQQPEQLDRLRSEPELMNSAVEEMLRHRGPIHGTKPGFALEDMELHGMPIKKGTAVMPLLGAANHDPSVFDKPSTFDIARTPNRHFSFGFGEHFCLGAQLARMEARIAIRTLLERNPNLALAIRPDELKVNRVPLWHRHDRLPVSFG